MPETFYGSGIPVSYDTPEDNTEAAEAEKLVKSYALAHITKIFSIIDMFFIFWWVIAYASYYPNSYVWFGLFAWIACTCGCMGATNYNIGALSFYLIYLLTALGFRIWYLWYSLWTPGYYYLLDVMLSVINLMIQVWLVSLTSQLIHVLKTFTPEERSGLKQRFLDHPPPVNFGSTQAPATAIPINPPNYAQTPQVPVAEKVPAESVV